MLEIIERESCSAAENMQFDEQLLNSLADRKDPVLHIHHWESSSVTYGCLIDPEKYLNLNQLRALGIDFAKRPTGGGIIFHLWDFSFGLLIPSSHTGYKQNTLESYRIINRVVSAAIHRVVGNLTLNLLEESPKEDLRFCMAKPTVFDVMAGDKKIVGAAQRRKPQGLLHQGSISLAPPDEEILSQALKRQEILEEMKKLSFSLLPDRDVEKMSLIRSQLKGALALELQKYFRQWQN